MAKGKEPLKLIPLDRLKKLGEALARVPKAAVDKKTSESRLSDGSAKDYASS